MIRALFTTLTVAFLLTPLSNAQTMPGPPIQDFTAFNNTSNTNITVVATNNITTGSNRYFVVTCAWRHSSGVTASVSDNAGGGAGHTYSVGAGPATGGSTLDVETFYTNISLGNGTKPTFTCTFSAAINYQLIDVSEWNNIGASAPKDTSSTGTDSANPARQAIFSAGSLTTASANTMLYTFCAPTGGGFNPGPFYTLISSTDGFISQYRLLYASGSYSVWVVSTSDGTSAAATCTNVAFKSSDQTATTAVRAGGSGGKTFNGSTSGSSSWSYTHNIPSGGSNRLCVVDVFTIGTNAPTSVNCGSAATQLASSNVCDGLSFSCQYVYQLVAPSAGANTVTVSFATATRGVAISSDYFNVNQTTPIAGLQTDNFSGNSNNGNTCGSYCNPAALTVLSAVGDYVYAGIGVEHDSMCPVSGTTMDWEGLIGGIPTVSVGHADGASSVTMSWNILTINTFPACPGTNTGTNRTRVHEAFDIQNVAAAQSRPKHKAVIGQ